MRPRPPEEPETTALLHYHHALRHLEAASLAWAKRDWARIRDHLQEAREDLRWTLRKLGELD